MTEYWKSQARKYCEFCKCWFADNKVSISFHENGKRHKENVQKHISQLTKKSTKEAKKREKMDDDIMKMETAAMAAYLKDVQNNADLTSQNINEMISETRSGESKVTIIANNTPQTKPEPVWHEVRNDDGSSYFWNTQTNDTTWDPPDEYLSIVQQDQRKLTDEKAGKNKEKLKKEQQKEAKKEVKAHIARERMRELAVNKDEPKRPPRPIISDVEFGPAPFATKPYGSWTPVVNEPEEHVDFQLPKPTKEVLPPPVIMKPEIIQFKEKRVESLGDGPVEFKKRKINNTKRNMRQKVEDE